VASVARFGRLDSSIHSYACSLVHSELSWWGLQSSLHSHVAHFRASGGSHYSVTSPYQHGVYPGGARQLRAANAAFNSVCLYYTMEVTICTDTMMVCSHVYC
jgi:hypothetical protein